MGSVREQKMVPTQSLQPVQDLQRTAKYANSLGCFHLKEKTGMKGEKRGKINDAPEKGIECLRGRQEVAQKKF